MHLMKFLIKYLISSNLGIIFISLLSQKSKYFVLNCVSPSVNLYNTGCVGGPLASQEA